MTSDDQMHLTSGLDTGSAPAPEPITWDMSFKQFMKSLIFFSGLLERRLAESITKKKRITLKDVLQLMEEAQATKDFLKPKTGEAACFEEDPTYALLEDKLLHQ